jgi:hypothetical protein
MPGPHNQKKKKRAQQKKKQHADSKAHTNAPSPVTVTVQPTCLTFSDLESSPTLISVLISGTPDEHGAENLWSSPVSPPLRHDTPSPPVSPRAYGPADDPILTLLSNPIIHDPGNGPHVRNMRAFLDSSFSQPAWMDDPLCAEFAQREILQMLCTVLPEETALVRTLIRCSTRPSSDLRSLPSSAFARSVYGTTRAAASDASAPRVSVCTR